MQHPRWYRMLILFVPVLALLSACDIGPATPVAAPTSAATRAATSAATTSATSAATTSGTSAATTGAAGATTPSGTTASTAAATSAATSAATVSTTGTPGAAGGFVSTLAFCQTAATPAATTAATSAATTAATSAATAVATRAATTASTAAAATPSAVGTRSVITTPAALNAAPGISLLGASAQITATPSVAATSAATSAATVSATSAATSAATTTPTSTLTITSSAQLHTVLGKLLSEHVYLVGNSTGAVVAARTDEARVAANTLDQNSQQLAQVMGVAYGSAPQQQFLSLWRQHTCYLLQYAQGTAANDASSKLDARTRLDNWRTLFDAFITGANPNLAKGSVAEDLKAHIADLLATIDAQGAKDQAKTYGSMKAAADHSQTLANRFADAIAKQFPDKFK